MLHVSYPRAKPLDLPLSSREASLGPFYPSKFFMLFCIFQCFIIKVILPVSKIMFRHQLKPSPLTAVLKLVQIYYLDIFTVTNVSSIIYYVFLVSTGFQLTYSLLLRTKPFASFKLNHDKFESQSLHAVLKRSCHDGSLLCDYHPIMKLNGISHKHGGQRYVSKSQMGIKLLLFILTG